jgi:hypothetical protein
MARRKQEDSIDSVKTAKKKLSPVYEFRHFCMSYITSMPGVLWWANTENLELLHIAQNETVNWTSNI